MESNLAYYTVPDDKQYYPGSQVNLPPASFLLEYISRGVIFVNTDGILTFINRYAAEVLHVQEETVIGKRLDMLPLRTPLYRLLSEQCNDAHLEMAVNGRMIAAQSTRVSSGNGILQGELTELWDITDEKKSKKEWEEFVAMTTHDLRSPLTVIMGFIQGMKYGIFGEFSSRVHTLVKMAEESGEKLNSMIEEMLDNFRLEMGTLNLKRQSCDMGKLLEGCYRDNLSAAEGQGINLALANLEGLPKLYVDCRQLTRVFNNLISNAIKYTLAPGEAIITPVLSDDALHVVVTDTGIGIPSEDLARIFFKYYRSSGVADIKGTGLGLAICKTIVEAHGGSIGVESFIGVGSKFTVSIPFSSFQDYESA